MSDPQNHIYSPSHNNQHLFSDHYLDEILPAHSKWSEIRSEAITTMAEITSIFQEFIPSENERQTEEDLVMPVLRSIGHTFEIQASLKTSECIKKPDYIFYRDINCLVTNKSKTLGDDLPTQGGIAVGDAKSWARSLDSTIHQSKSDALSNKNPSYQIYYYMLHSGVTWGILTNGKQWRLYHKDSAHKFDHFYEIDLQELIESKDIDRFLYFYIFFRRGAFTDSILSLDGILAESIEYALNVGNSLKNQVYDALRHIAQGFLDYQANNLNADSDTLKAIYDNSLILLYRLLFILYAEARELLPVRENQSYHDNYSLHSIKESIANDLRTGRILLPDSAVLWPKLQFLFDTINKGNRPLSVATFNGGLFDPDKHSFLFKYTVGDAHLQQAIDKLARVNGEFVDYRDLSVRNLGTIYEGLLEFILQPLSTPEDGWKIELINDKGERKTTGSYYTPDFIVKYIVEHTIGPVIERSVNDKKSEKDKLNAILRLNILDPAMGSGHFLVEAVEYIARYLVDMAIVPDGKTSEEADLAFWKRRVVQSCIYGVDLNPLAVELAKLSLWLTTVAKDRPLSFLDHHLRPGNSLIGARLEHLELKASAKKRKKSIVESENNGQISLFDNPGFTCNIKIAVGNIWQIEVNEAAHVEDVKEQERIYDELRHKFIGKYSRLLNVVTASQFGMEIDAWLRDSLIKYLTNGNGTSVPAFEKRLKQADEIARDQSFFHWELEFPEIYFDEHGRSLGDEGGFDAVIGNPPWERIKLQENEFFSRRDREVALAQRASDRKSLIASLKKKQPHLWNEYESAKTNAEKFSSYVRSTGFYPMMGRGDTNLYAIFAEKALQVLNKVGRIGFLVPSGIATDDTTKDYFQYLVSHRILSELLDFENREAVFPEVHRSFKFSIILVNGESTPQNNIRCGFFLHNQNQIADPERICYLTPDDFKLFNPNTLTCPIFRRRRDAELAKRIYENSSVLIDKASGDRGNLWNISFQRMFDMTNDSHLFNTAAELEKAGCWLGEGNVYIKGQEKYLPLYEGKMVQMYDHRAATIIVNPENIHRPAQELPVSSEQHTDPQYSPLPQFWIDSTAIYKALACNPKWLFGFKSITAPTNVRSFICAPIPIVAVGNSMPIIRFNDRAQSLSYCLLANMSTYVFDFAARQKIGGQNLNFFVVEQLPVLPPSIYKKKLHGNRLDTFIKERVLELCYTANDLKGFAEDLGYSGPPFKWDEERRLHLRCQLDALYFHLYNLSREESSEILDTFPIVKRQDETKFGRFRTKDLILAYYNAYNAGNVDAWVQV